MNVLNNTIDKLLAEVGLNQSEREVYGAGLSAAHTSAELRRLTGLPRPTVMAALRELRDYGLCETHRLDGRSLNYAMLPVSRLKQYVGRKVRGLDDLMDRLESADKPTGHMQTTVYEGQAAVQDVLELALRCKSRRWQIIAPRDNALSHMPAEYQAYFKRIRSERQIQAETLWEDAESGQQVPLRDVLMRKPRYIPKQLKASIPSLLLSFDDSVLIINGTTEPSAVLMTGSSVTATLGLLFTMAWRYAREA